MVESLPSHHKLIFSRKKIVYRVLPKTSKNLKHAQINYNTDIRRYNLWEMIVVRQHIDLQENYFEGNISNYVLW